MRWTWLGGSTVLAALAMGACIANAPTGIERETDATGGMGGTFAATSSDAASTGTSIGTGNNDPHAVLGATPPHGPFKGGQLVQIAGKGFKPEVRVWFGDIEAEGAIAIDPTRLQVNAPAAAPGTVDLHTQNGDDDSTRRTLPSGYTYDALYAEPSTGPVAGGTVISIRGFETNWDEDLIDARIDNQPCTTLQVLGPDELSCIVPKGTPGTKSISVQNSQGVVTALDAYTYQDSTDGFKGGLSGAPLNGELKVLVYNNFTGEPLEGAHVIVGDDLSTGLYQQVDSSGVVIFQDPTLDSPVTVTVAAHCHSPISFVDVPVDSVTTYLNPVLSPICAENGDPPPVGGNPTLLGLVEGQLIWPSSQEFQKGTWSNIPSPQADEERIAYLFFATGNPNQTFVTPSIAFAVTEDSPGEFGYGFSISSRPGNRTLYALAGLRNTTTNKFTPYAMGATTGVAVFPGEQTEGLAIHMTVALDQALQLNVNPPPPGPTGPDRLNANVAIELTQDAFAILPSGKKTPLLPLSGPISFIGLPGLDQQLTGARYVVSAEAVTGPSLTAPLSAVGDQATNTTSVPLTMDGFVAVPQLTSPVSGGLWNGQNLAVDYPQGGFPAQLTVYEVIAGDGLWRWLVAVPHAAHSIQLPDLSGFDMASLPPGPLEIGVYGARIDDFDYGNIGYRNLRPFGMTAYALDFFSAHL